jgi:hypothetical protein
MAKNTSHFASDSMKLEWETENTRPDKKIISDRFHSDAIDSTLYAYREALNWLSEPEVNAPMPYTDAWFKDQEDKMFQNLLDQQNEQKYQNQYDSEWKIKTWNQND